MGLPIFREPTCAPLKPAVKSEPLAHARSEIRRQRTVRAPRRQAEVHSTYRRPRLLRALHAEADEYARYADPYPRPANTNEYDTNLDIRQDLTSPGFQRPLSSQNDVSSRRPQQSAQQSDTRYRPYAAPRFPPSSTDGRPGIDTNRASSTPPASLLPLNTTSATFRNTSARSRGLEAQQDSGLLHLSDGSVNWVRTLLPNPEPTFTNPGLAYAYSPTSGRRSDEPGEIDEVDRYSRRPQSRRGPIHSGSRIPELDGFPPLRRYTNRYTDRAEHSSIGHAPSRVLPRSWTPEYDQWETMLSTITPDTYLPSTDSSFTSAVASSSSNDSASSSATHITAPSASEFEHGFSLQHVCDDSCVDHDESDSESGSTSHHQASHAPPPAPSPPPIQLQRTDYWSISTSGDETLRHHGLTRAPDPLPTLNTGDNQPGNVLPATTRDGANSLQLTYERVLNRLIRRFHSTSHGERSHFQVLPSETEALVEAMSASTASARLPPYVVRAIQIVGNTNGSLRRGLARGTSADDETSHDAERALSAHRSPMPSPYPWVIEQDSTGSRLLANPYAIERDIDTNEPRLPSASHGFTAHTSLPPPPSPPPPARTSSQGARGVFIDEPTPPNSRSPSSASLRRSFLNHAAEYSRRHMPGVHDEDAEGELDQMRRILERLQQSEDVPDSWWASAGLRREV